MNALTRDDTLHGVEYVTLHEAQLEIDAANQRSMTAFDEVKKLQQQVRDLQAWKESAMTVLGEWEEVWEAVGKPGRLGASKAMSVRECLSNHEQQTSA